MKKRGIFKFVMLNGHQEGCLKQTSSSSSSSKPWASAHTDLGGGLSPPPPKTPRALSLRAPLAGYVSSAVVIAAKPRRCAVPFVRVTTRAKRRAVFHLSSGGILEPALGLYFTTSHIVILSFKKVRGDSESLLNGAAWRPKAPGPSEGTAKRQDFQPVAVIPET
jgi:hypothetical protein